MKNEQAIHDITDFLEQFEDTIEVTIFEDNKYVIGTYNMISSDLINELTMKNFSLHGISSNEFYIVKSDDTALTFQVSNFSLDSEIGI